MNDRPARDPRANPDDQALRLQLRALKPSAAAVDALGDQVLAQWRELHGESELAPATPSRSGAATLRGEHPAQRWRCRRCKPVAGCGICGRR